MGDVVKRFESHCRKIVAEYTNKHSESTITEEEVYTVWICKTIQNVKGLFVTPIFDHLYFEVTLNGDANEIYVDVYKKQEKMTLNADEIVQDEWATTMCCCMNRKKENQS